MRGEKPSRIDVAGFAGPFVVAAILLATYFFAGTATYEAIVDPRGAVMQVDGKPRAVDREQLVALHRETLAYILADAERLPYAPGTDLPLFDANERTHMEDVRLVFGRVKFVLLFALGVLLWWVVTAARRSRSYLTVLVRNGAMTAVVLVAAVGIGAAVAFEPLFLAFHQVFFPQGNFLFDPATSNLLAVYPEAYWYGVTLRIGAATVGISAVVALGAALVQHRSSLHSAE